MELTSTAHCQLLSSHAVSLCKCTRHDQLDPICLLPAYCDFHVMLHVVFCVVFKVVFHVVLQMFHMPHTKKPCMYMHRHNLLAMCSRS